MLFRRQAMLPFSDLAIVLQAQAAEPMYAQATNAEQRMDRTRSIIMNSASWVAIETLPILLTGSIHLNLGELFLQTALYRLAFLQREAEVVEACSVDDAIDDCDFPTLRYAVGPNNLRPDLHAQLCHLQVPFPGKAVITPRFLPPSFPLPQSHRSFIRAEPMTAIDAPPLILLSETNDLLTYFYPFETICACPRETAASRLGIPRLIGT
ncbi:hypothetical protein CDO25_23630 (plasmid) [Sinorhizobium meliloti]|nr:hypothetical protein CDO25_23630 [Sinorhizobium meliloti]